MNAEQRQAVPYSPEFVHFKVMRGHGVGENETHLAPTTPEQIIEAKRLSSQTLSLLRNPAFRPIATNIVGLSGNWFQEGRITEQQRMEIVRTNERVVGGETIEELYERIKSRI